MEILLNVALLIVGFVLLVKGADFFVEGASGVASKFGIPQLIIGLTIVAMGTSAPEAAVSITAALNGNAGLTVGNVVGSNILNVLVILGITAVIIPVAIQKSTLQIELPAMIVISAIMVVFGYTGEVITRVEGIILFVLFLVYLAYLFYMAKKGKEEVEEAHKMKPVWLLLVMTIGGIAMIVLGSDFVVDSASFIASKLGMSESFIGLTIVAFGTSLPELVTSVTAAKKGKADIAIGNIVGSNIFNILMVVGLSAVITPVVYDLSSFFIDGIVMIAIGILLLFGVMKSKKLEKPIGVVMLLCYAAYFVYLVVNI
ncbi:MAG: calcium/sodium antiporter [Lachnospiraceae bacterium]|nr:calcium/sodium antiporter [Lachnospiraceae bacterium]